MLTRLSRPADDEADLLAGRVGGHRCLLVGGEVVIHGGRRRGFPGQAGMPARLPASSRRGRTSRASRAPRRHDGDMTMRVVLADDHPVVRGGLRALLRTIDGFEVVGEAEDGEAAVREVQLPGPTCVLIDVRMPVLDGVEATRRVRGPRPRRPC